MAPCLLSGSIMLGVPGVWALLAAPGKGSSVSSSGAAALGLLVGLVLLVGAISVATATARPRQPALAALAVLCAGLALVFGPIEAWAAGLTGLAALAFVLSVRLHATALRGPVDLEEWLVNHRPVLIGAAVTTPAAVAAALVPAAWSLLVAALVGVAAAGVCAALLAT